MICHFSSCREHNCHIFVILHLKIYQVPKPLCKEKPSPEDSVTLQKFRKYQNYLRNPHFQPLSHQRGGKSLLMPEKRVAKCEKGKKQR